MTCPQHGEWFHGKDSKAIHDGYTYTFKYDDSKKGRYYCKNNDMRYNFYVQGKGE